VGRAHLTWPAIRTANGWVHQAARRLENEDDASGSEVRRRMDALLAEMRDEQATVGALQPAVAHFLKVSASYRPGLFHGYDVPGLPRTNNDLEQYLGSARYRQRRANGPVRATATTVVRGSVRVLAAPARRRADARRSTNPADAPQFASVHFGATPIRLAGACGGHIIRACYELSGRFRGGDADES
jgi:hypothetical protein